MNFPVRDSMKNDGPRRLGLESTSSEATRKKRARLGRFRVSFSKDFTHGVTRLLGTSCFRPPQLGFFLRTHIRFFVYFMFFFPPFSFQGFVDKYWAHETAQFCTKSFPCGTKTRFPSPPPPWQAYQSPMLGALRALGSFPPASFSCGSCLVIWVPNLYVCKLSQLDHE